MNWFDVLVGAAQIPALQGLLVALATQGIKKAPVGPSGGPGVRLVAACLSLASVVANHAASGTLADVDSNSIGQLVIEAASAFLAAVGAWQIAKKSGQSV